MPDALHALPETEKAAAAEALTHFLISLQTPDATPPSGMNAAAMEAGRQLYHEIGCVMCHAPVDLPAGKASDPTAAEALAQLKATSVPLGDLARKFSVPGLAEFLRDPLKARPAGRMPAMKLSTSEAESVAMWLVRAQTADGPPQQIAGLKYEYYEKELPELPEFDRLKPDAVGIAAQISLAPAKQKNGYALRFIGTLTAPTEGEYTFFTESDDGSRLFIDGQQIVDNGGTHPKQTREGKIRLKAGPHAVTVTYFDSGGDTALEVMWQGPGLAKATIPPGALTHDGQPMLPLGHAPFSVDTAKAARGKELFAQFNCASCHAGTDVPGKKARALVALKARQPAGCISPVAKAGVPRFELTDRQRIVIQAALGNQEVLAVALEPEQQIRRTLTVLNCYSCHSRDRRGGADGLRRDYFTSVGEVDLGDEGRIPPHLHGVGAKLRPEWIKSVLTEGGAVRPYMATRMPQFGEKNVEHLPALFDEADARPEAAPQPDVFAPGVAADSNKFGRKLIGVGGLSCIACHNFAGNKSLGIPAVDLATTGQRLKWDWFRRYLLDPQALRPGTRMPAFWPGGVAPNKEIAGGDAERQIFSIWGYLARKNFTDLPAGLVQGKQELVPTNEAVIYRNFIEGGGPRAIGVGYPEKANLCFDANEVRLALIWQGAFIDAAKHRNGRGQGYEKPLGTNVVQAPPGAPFAMLDSESAPWPDKVGKDAGYQFRGYRLDDRQRPTFRYTFAGIEVEDFSEAISGPDETSLRRTLTLRATSPVTNLYFRAAVAGKIESEADGTFLVGETLKLKFPGAKAVVRRIGDQSELLVPVAIANGEGTLTEEISW